MNLIPRIAPTGLALLATAWIPASGQTPAPAGPKPAAAPAKPEKQEKKEDVDPAFSALSKEFVAASRTWQAEVKKARDAKVPQADWPPSPVKDFWARFESMAKADNPRALRWCLDNAEDLDLSGEETNQRRLALYRALVERHSDEDATRDALRGLVSDARPLGVEAAEGLCAQAASRTTREDVRAAALYTQAQINGNVEGDEARTARAKELYRELIAKHPDSKPAASAKGRLFALEHLQIGMTPPDYEANDVDGVPFKLSDYRGKVVVLDFWGFW